MRSQKDMLYFNVLIVHNSEKLTIGLIACVLTYNCVSFRILHQKIHLSTVKLSIRE